MMGLKMSQQLLHYYNTELDYLRKAGKNFSRQYPKIGRRLELSDSESPDPHVERLIESFAFLTGRISKEIDDQYPETAAALLNILYPHLVNPVPAMGIAHMKADPSRGNLTTGFKIPKGTVLNATAHEGIDCKFTTVYSSTLWPVEVDVVNFMGSNKINRESFKSDWVLRIRLKSMNVDFKDMQMDHIDFHIACDKKLALVIYQLLFSQTNIEAALATDGATAYKLPEDSVIPLGFDSKEMALPMGDHSVHSYQLIQDYFHLPEKFLFFRVQNMLKSGIDLSSGTLDLFIGINDVGSIYDTPLKPEHFLLGATPIVNLFKKSSDPFRLDRKQTNYRLIPDQRLDKTTEVYSIQKVLGSVEGETDPMILSPYYCLDHHTSLNPDTVYWVQKRTSASIRDLSGSDIYLSFVDMNFRAQMPPQQIIYAETLCTNRYLAEQLPYNTVLQAEESLPVSQIICLDKPVPQTDSPEDGTTLWKLISQLSVNHMGLTSASGLVEMLKLYLRNSRHSHFELDAIKDLSVKPTIRRVNQEAWRGYVRGQEATLVMEDTNYTGGSTFLLASVLRHYFGFHVGINSFVEIVLKYDQKEVMRWKPLPGSQISL